MLTMSLHHHGVVVTLSIQLLLYFKYGTGRHSLIIMLLSVRVSLQIDLMNGAHGIVQLILCTCSCDHVLVVIAMTCSMPKILVSLRTNQLMLTCLLRPRMLSRSYCFACGHLLFTGGGDLIHWLLHLTAEKNGGRRCNWSRQGDRQRYGRLC